MINQDIVEKINSVIVELSAAKRAYTETLNEWNSGLSQLSSDMFLQKNKADVLLDQLSERKREFDASQAQIKDVTEKTADLREWVELIDHQLAERHEDLKKIESRLIGLEKDLGGWAKLLQLLLQYGPAIDKYLQNSEALSACQRQISSQLEIVKGEFSAILGKCEALEEQQKSIGAKNLENEKRILATAKVLEDLRRGIN